MRGNSVGREVVKSLGGNSSGSNSCSSSGISSSDGGAGEDIGFHAESRNALGHDDRYTEPALS